jgi:adenylyltransferase/sulfurtransferase
VSTLHIPNDTEGRYHRQELIEWWDQGCLERARVVVVGAGALGNEILKNLALVGVGAVLVADMDRIETSNLSRSVLFRQEDVGLPKAEVAVRRYRELHPGGRIEAFVGNVVFDLGAGVFHWADVVVGGLDNREARVAVNRTCLRVQRPWVDGAIERLDGVMRVFRPDGGACYECTMSEVDWQMLEARRSCALLGREQVAPGHVATTATTSSVVAGLQCQEVLKLLHGQDVRGGEGVVVNGQAGDVYRVSYQRLEDCMAHDPVECFVELPCTSGGITVGDLLDRARSDLGSRATLELSREILHLLECPECSEREPVFSSLGRVSEGQARCPGCGVQRIPHLLHAISGDEGLLDRSPAQLGLPPFDLVVARCGLRAVGYLVSGDAPAVLGAVANASSR